MVPPPPHSGGLKAVSGGACGEKAKGGLGPVGAGESKANEPRRTGRKSLDEGPNRGGAPDPGTRWAGTGLRADRPPAQRGRDGGSGPYAERGNGSERGKGSRASGPYP